MTSEQMVAPGRRDEEITAPDLPPREILIVDDDPIFRYTLRRMLMRSGDTRVVEAQDASEAIAAIERHRPDLVVSDIFMPVADGFELLNWMRDQRLDVPVLVVSAAAQSDDQFDPLVIAQHLGAAGVMTKPFDRTDLLAAVDRALGH